MPENNEKDENNNTDPFPQPDMGGKDFPEMDPAGKDPEVISEEEETEAPEVDLEDIPQADVAAANAQAAAEKDEKIKDLNARREKAHNKAEQAKNSKSPPQALTEQFNNLVSAVHTGIEDVFGAEIIKCAAEEKSRIIESEKEKYRVKDLKSLALYLAEKIHVLPAHKITVEPDVNLAAIAEQIFNKYIAKAETGVKLLKESHQDNKDKRIEIQQKYENLEDAARDQIHIHKEATAERDKAYKELCGMTKRRDELLKQKTANQNDQSIANQYEQQCINVKTQAAYVKKLERALKDTEADMLRDKVAYIGTKKQMQFYEGVEDVCSESLAKAEMHLEVLKELKSNEKGRASLRMTFERIAEAMADGEKTQKIATPFYAAMDGIFKALANVGNKLSDASTLYGMESVGTYAQSKRNKQSNICQEMEKEVFYDTDFKAA